MTVPERHQLKIARDTLKMTPIMAKIMGGMDYEMAYRIVFKTELKPRLEQLIRQYGDNPAWLSWELDVYGWTPRELLDAISDKEEK
jgi:hypothetical protein